MPFPSTRYHYTEQELKDAGLVYNPNMWLGNGYFWCSTCNDYRMHIAMSHKGVSDCYEVCLACKTYTGIRDK